MTRRSAPGASSGDGDSEIRAALASGLLIFATATAAAAEDNPNVELTPFGGYRFGGTFEFTNSADAYKLDDSPSFGLILNLRDKANTQWELFYSNQSTDARLSSSAQLQQKVGVDAHVLQLGGTYQGRYGPLRPYVALTLGGTHIKTDADSDTFFSGSIGLGVQLNPDARLGVRLEARAYGTLTSSSTDLFCRTGPDENVCAVRVDGDVLSQFETFAGLVFRF